MSYDSLKKEYLPIFEGTKDIYPYIYGWTPKMEDILSISYEDLEENFPKYAPFFLFMKVSIDKTLEEKSDFLTVEELGENKKMQKYLDQFLKEYLDPCD